MSKTLNMFELEKAVSTKTEVKFSDVNKITRAIFDIITENLAKKVRVKITGFGTFYPKDKQARNGVNPSTGEKIKIPAKTVPKIIFSNVTREAVKIGKFEKVKRKKTKSAAKPAAKKTSKKKK